jgi:hypothetical protein
MNSHLQGRTELRGIGSGWSFLHVFCAERSDKEKPDNIRRHRKP